MTVSTSTTASLQSVSNNHGILELLLIDHPSFASPVRIVNDTRDWTIGADTYIALPFTLKLPSQVQNENPRASIQIDNVGREISGLLEGLPTTDFLTATLRVVSRATPSVVDFEFIADLSAISVTPVALSASFGLDDTMRRSAVRLRFDPTTAPALFAG